MLYFRVILRCTTFFFQAEDGIRDGHVTGVQTCALPISGHLLALLGSCGDRSCAQCARRCAPQDPREWGHCDGDLRDRKSVAKGERLENRSRRVTTRIISVSDKTETHKSTETH